MAQNVSISQAWFTYMKKMQFLTAYAKEESNEDSPFFWLKDPEKLSLPSPQTICKGISSSAMQLEHSHPVMSKFNRLLEDWSFQFSLSIFFFCSNYSLLNEISSLFQRVKVEGRHNNLGCFYLSENLDEYKDYILRTQNEEEEYVCDLPHALPDSFNQQYGGSVNVYTDQSLCFHLGMIGAKDQCFNPEGFASFIGLLESIPFHDPGPDYQLFEHSPSVLRYVLKKRFARGSYGEVWLAFHGNCQEAFSSVGENDNVSCNSSFEDINARNYGCSSNSSQAYSLENNLFIMKRVMVERGAGIYLSGLREKYFGEIFFNASTCLGDVLSTGTSNFVFEESPWGSKDLLTKDESLCHKVGETRHFENISPNRFQANRVIYEEGTSLSKLMYSIENADEEKVEQKNHVQILRPSKWWHWLKTTEAGQEEMKNLIRQLLLLPTTAARVVVGAAIFPATDTATAVQVVVDRYLWSLHIHPTLVPLQPFDGSLAKTYIEKTRD
ncbi:putative protein phosphatase 2C 51 isoform X2 [Cucumis melo var. makuwa]|uniref:Uncharacterized protein n=1 Tax=Cucumis melo var. makuwa TaxID=1194695 RepID=A0A5D3E3E3_CUCMM|nr:putative protein phosphatase 2C 51 isoform X2 [Cucumis melo var. makuwa]